MIKKLLSSIFLICSPVAAHGANLVYTMDGHEENWTAFHYEDKVNGNIDSCFAISNDLGLGFKSNKEGTGLVIWDQQGQQKPQTDKQAAITVGKQHFIFTMKAMDRNMLMNRMQPDDFRKLLRSLSFGQMALIEYGQHPVSIVDLSGMPTMLNYFNKCNAKAGFTKIK
ncbi:hypothetical protein [Commensalibacter oyaizuii]|uniref:Uncharacterized protein n=1 Tax=Commensalibacter oyaizuii TaxID=3043873 RepID=A0ABT6PZD1_9PROT|nr:hypothetical protein [Commensalibacter sp. TBRC 16381]MDI2090174.1 hypothetical protein [Commensalibacter sp. TBRC 16381]